MMSEKEIKNIFKDFGLLKEEDRKKFLILNTQQKKSYPNNLIYATGSNTNTNKKEDINNAKLE